MYEKFNSIIVSCFNYNHLIDTNLSNVKLLWFIKTSRECKRNCKLNTVTLMSIFTSKCIRNGILLTSIKLHCFVLSAITTEFIFQFFWDFLCLNLNVTNKSFICFSWNWLRSFIDWYMAYKYLIIKIHKNLLMICTIFLASFSKIATDESQTWLANAL